MWSHVPNLGTPQLCKSEMSDQSLSLQPFHESVSPALEKAMVNNENSRLPNHEPERGSFMVWEMLSRSD